VSAKKIPNAPACHQILFSADTSAKLAKLPKAEQRELAAQLELEAALIRKRLDGNKVTKAKAKATPMPMEYAGDMIEANIWYKIGLTKAEAPMLKTIGQRIFNQPVNSARVLRTLLLSALAHYDKLEPMMFGDVAYSQAEGFVTTDKYLHSVITGQHAKSGEGKGKGAL